MKKSVLSILLTIAFILPASAQTGLNINQIFSERYRDMKGATETILSGDRLSDAGLDLYHSITFKGHPELGPVIERLVASDGAKALSKEVKYKSGHLYYGFYRLTKNGNLNRYVLYLNGTLAGEDKIILLFLEGKASPEKIKKLINK